MWGKSDRLQDFDYKIIKKDHCKKSQDKVPASYFTNKFTPSYSYHVKADISQINSNLTIHANQITVPSQWYVHAKLFKLFHFCPQFHYNYLNSKRHCIPIFVDALSTYYLISYKIFTDKPLSCLLPSWCSFFFTISLEHFKCMTVHQQKQKLQRSKLTFEALDSHWWLITKIYTNKKTIDMHRNKYKICTGWRNVQNFPIFYYKALPRNIM